MNDEQPIIPPDPKVELIADQTAIGTSHSIKKFGTFQGVFTPTLLTILGVIMYIRGPWVVGNAGVAGAIIIISVATAITFFTSLSMSSIVTNIRIKAGGAFSIIAQSLGLEVGGAIGLPLYLAQAFAVAMYIFGFREGWLWLFPNHSAILVDLITFGLIFGIANISTDFAFKIQYVVLVIIGLSLISIGLGVLKFPIQDNIQWFGNYPGSVENNFSGSSFWIVFAVFFPAVTGVMAGANMSGDLSDPRVSIPSGTLSAIVLSYFIYIFLAVFIAFIALPNEMVSNYNILIDRSFFAPIVLAGLLGATFSSALSSLVGAPRILFALGQNKILTGNDKLARVDKRGEPKIALYITSIIVLLSLLLRDLNAIAPLLTMFFLITYAMINVVVLIEQGLGQISFRPTLKVPMIVPLLGAIGCFFVMFIINSTVGIIALALIVAMYIYLLRSKSLMNEEGDVRSGLFNSLAEWSAKVVSGLPAAEDRSWQPNLIVPADQVDDVLKAYKTIFNLARPKGSIKILYFTAEPRKRRSLHRIKELCAHFMKQNVSANYAVIESSQFNEDVLTAIQGLTAAFFKPNTLFLSLSDDKDRDEDIHQIMSKSNNFGFGVYLYAPYKRVGLGIEKSIMLWISYKFVQEIDNWKLKYINLSILTAYLLKRNWHGFIRMTIYDVPINQNDMVIQWANDLKILARLPKELVISISNNGIEETAQSMDRPDVSIIPLKNEKVEMDTIRQLLVKLESSCIFTLDGGSENALA